jgi:probable F420-dependent oxidoreductase
MIMARGPGAQAQGLTAMAKAAEDGNLDMIAINDHIVVPTDIDSAYPYTNNGVWPGAAAGECLEMVTAGSFIAAATEKIRILTSVLVVPYRPAVLAAKMLATVDVLSEGRLTVGCGAGWMSEESTALGVPPFNERGAVTDEYIAAFKELWSAKSPRMDGSYVKFEDIIFEPKPIQDPHPPIWVGGESSAAIKRAARIGDGWYPSNHNPVNLLNTPQRFAAASARLNEQAEKFGRDGANIHRAYLAFYPVSKEISGPTGKDRRCLSGTATEIRDDIDAFEDAGVDTIIFSVGGRELNEIVDNVAWLSRDVLL